nr:response regulator transcription factor [Paenibacillus sambharensis]
MQVNLLIVDDHPSVIEGTKVMLQQSGDVKVTMETSPSRVLEELPIHRYDVMLIDLFMREADGREINGIDLASEILRVSPEEVILIYTGFDISPHLNRLIESGISGFVSKTATSEQLMTGIRCAMRREVVLPITTFRQLRQMNSEAVSEVNSAMPAVTEREIAILQQIAMGRGNRVIADSMAMSQRSLEYILTQLFQKLGVKSRVEAVSKAELIGILPR